MAGGPLGEVYWPDYVSYNGGSPRVVAPFPLTAEVEDGADRFWRLGPVVSAMYRWAHGVLACECRHVTRSSP